MSRSRTITYGAINLSAEPHPPGTYARILNTVAKSAGPTHGSDWAKFTRASESGIDGIVIGRILVWTHIDTSSPWVDLETEEAISQEAAAEFLPPEKYGPNLRVFSFAFHEKKHRIYVELRNEFSQTISINTVERLLASITAKLSGSNGWPEITTTVVPQHGAVAKILGLDNLRRLEISLTVPNPDDDDPATRRRFYRKMRKMKAKKWEQNLVKAAGEERLEPSREIVEAATAAAVDGEVKGWGKLNGKLVNLSTKDVPRTEKAKLDDGENFAQRILAAKGFF